MRVFLVDSQPLFREGLKSIIGTEHDFKVVGESGTFQDAIETAPHTDVLILDGEVESLALLESLGRSRSKNGPPYVLVLTREVAEEHAIQFVSAGADGYLHKTDSPETILNAIRKVARGGKYIPNHLAEKLIFAANRVNGPDQLSRREYQVLRLLASGMCATEIAGHLSLSVKTISTYRSRVLDKLQLRNNAELMRYALKKGLAD